MATITTVRTQRPKEPDFPYPPNFKSLNEVQAYLKLLYTALKDNRDKGYAGSVFLSADAPQSYVGKDGDMYIQIEE